MEIVETKIQFIEGKVKKNSIKISFFGTVSAGKSKVLNTLLGENLFLSTQGDTTSCFVRVCKSDKGCHYLSENDLETNFNSLVELKQKVIDLTTRLSKNTTGQLATNKTVQVFLNIDNTILKNNTEIIDCPGSNNKGEVTECIKQQSLDSDIFIYVMTCTLTDEEKDFFEYQSKLSSKPDIFVLVNKWDLSDQDDLAFLQKSRDKVQKELTNLLNKYGNFSSEEARKRIFFISAQEMYRLRIDKQDILGADKNNQAIQMRSQEFYSFEKSLLGYISNREQIKWDRHIPDVEETIKDLKSIRNNFKTELLEKRKLEEFQTTKMKDLSDFLKGKKKGLQDDLNKKFKETTEHFHKKADKIIKKINIYNIIFITQSLKGLQAKADTDLVNIQNDSNDKIEEMKDKYKDVMGKYTFQKERYRTLKKDLEKNILLQITPPKSFWERIKAWIMSWFYHKEEDEIRRILENQNVIIRLKTEISEYVKEVQEHLEKYVDNLYENMSKSVSKNIEYMDNYWDDVEQLLQYNDLPEPSMKNSVKMDRFY